MQDNTRAEVFTIKDVQEGFTCKQCREQVDLMVAFTEYQICGKCTRKNHKQAISV